MQTRIRFRSQTAARQATRRSGGCHEALGIFNQHYTGAVVVEENKRHATIAHTRELQARGL